ncbi:hypothetical protein BDR03DRAFT_987077 [Suillus americanus]|nr:hypothetical protein BDR03DRAFT_987077 [Suillus americanus]
MPRFYPTNNVMKSSLGTRACTLRNLLNKVHLRQHLSELLEVSQTHTFLPLESSCSTSLEPHSPLLTLWILCLPRRPRQTILSQAYRAVLYRPSFHHSPRHSWPSVWQPPAYAQLPIHARFPVEQFLRATSIYELLHSNSVSFIGCSARKVNFCLSILPTFNFFEAVPPGDFVNGKDVMSEVQILSCHNHHTPSTPNIPALEHNPFTNHTLQHYPSTQPHPSLTHPPALPSLTAQ